MKALLAALLLAGPALATEAQPLSLTASDGTGLKLTRLKARAVVQDPLAFTELELTFENPLDRVIEGQFKVTLPPGAAISRFAMKLDDRWQEGEVVERAAARAAYEDFLHRRQDPALLEQGGANEFTARVFPIPARGVKQLVVSYSHELVSGTSDYVLPLKGLSEVGELDVQVVGATAEPLAKKHFVPSSDFVAKVDRGAGLRSGDLSVVRVVPVAQAEADPLSEVLFLVDSSASRSLGWRDQVELVRALVAALAQGSPQAQVSVAAFDQGVQPIYVGAASGFGQAQAKQLRDWSALGASNVEAALLWAAGAPRARVVLVGDGVATAGATEGPQLQSAVLKLKAAGVKRLDAVVLGGIRDEAALARLATAGLERDGAVIDGALGVTEVARRLSLATRSRLPVKVAGASWWWPTSLAGIQAGDSVLVYAQLPAAAPIAITVGSAPVRPDPALQLRSVERPLLERSWARAKLSALEAALDAADGEKQRAQVKAQMIELSTRHRVLSRFTALLVLETEADYARFHIDRSALAKVLIVGDGKLEVLQRPAAEPRPSRPPQVSSEDRVLAARPPKPTTEEKKKEIAGDDFDQSFSPGAGGAPAAPPAETAAPSLMPAAEATPEPRPSPAVAMPPPRALRAPTRRAPSGAASGDREMDVVTGDDGSTQAWNKGSDPYVGPFKKVMDALAKGDKAGALASATGWHEEAPGDVMALVAMGEALEASGDPLRAARAYGSIIDLFPARADLRRFSGVRLERLTHGLELAIDTFAKAAEQRPDHPASHRLLAFALLKHGEYSKAFAAITAGVSRSYPAGRFLGVDRILREDAGLIAAAWAAAEKPRAAEIAAKLKAIGGTVESEPSLRFILNWETDANDVDFHISDGKGGHAFYSSPHLRSGGDLYADVTTGYGPECFTIRLPKAKRAYPYRLQAHYYSIGPMGAGMGKLELIEHDGKGGLRFDERPYVVMVNQAYVDLGWVKE